VRVLQLAPWVTFGGSDRGTIEWLRALSARGLEAYLLTTQESDNALFGEAERWAAEAWCLPELVPGDRMPAFIEHFVASRGIDVVQVMNSKLGFDLLPRLRARFPHLRTVVQLHAEEEGRAGYPSYVATRFDDAVDAYSLVSQGLADRMCEYGVDPSKAHVIYLGVDATTFDPDRATPAPVPAAPGLQILFPHRLSEQKDPLLMVEVAAALRRRGSEAVVHVVGDGDFRPALEQAIEAAGLGDRVILHGTSRHMPAWYAATDVTLLTSRFEGVPLVAYEAMAMGRPVVAGEVGAIGELVDEHTGFVVRPRDSLEGYVAALLALEQGPGLRHSLGQEGRRRVLARFTVESMAQAHERLYAHLLGDRTATPEVAVAGRRSVLDRIRRGRARPPKVTGLGGVWPDFDDAPPWTPPETAPLWLVRRDRDLFLVVGDERPAGGDETSRLLGRVFTRPFWRTIPVVSDGRGLQLGAEGDAVGHVMSAGLPGMVELHAALEAALAESEVHEPGGRPLLQGDTGPAWVDLPHIPPA
jgi:glycosyltransferase involved in cell wall biosynthesis